MQFVEITAENIAQYQAFVQTKGIFLQDRLWGDFQQSLGKKVYRYAVIEQGEVLASAQFIAQRALGFAYLFAPYGPVLAEANLTLLHFLLAEVKKLFPKALLIRVEPQMPEPKARDFSLKSIGLQPSLNLNPHKTLVLDLTKPEQQLLSEMHPKTRYNIKVAQRDGVEIKMHDAAAELLQPLFDTSKRAGIRSFSASYYEQLVKNFSGPEGALRAKVFTAWHEEDLLATNIVVFYQNTCIYLFGGSGNIKRNLMAPYLLQWQTMQKAKEEGYKKYDFWGVEDDKTHAWAGISRFKFGFGGEIKKYFGTFDFVCRPAWYNVYSALRALNRILRK